MFLVNSCQRYFRCGPHHFRYFGEKNLHDEELNFLSRYLNLTLPTKGNSLRKYPKWWGQALSRSYGCFFAEFLGDHSLVRLGLLDLITCVGLRYGFYIHKFREFSWKRALYHYSPANGETFCFSFMCHQRHCTDFPTEHNQDTNFKSNNERYILPSVIPSQNTEVWEY